MKRFLFLSTACLGVAGAAAAQSSVTIYGVIDQTVSRVSGGSSSLYMPPAIEAKHDMWVLKAGDPSRLGFRGVEDFGGGWSAGFQLEHRLMPDTGTTDSPGGSTFWQGRSLVWLRSDRFGEVFAGRDNFAAFFNGVQADPFLFDYGVAALGPDFTLARYTVAGEGGSRVSNQAGWRSPRLGGVALTLSMAAGEGSSTGRRRNEGLNLNYQQGPLYLGLGWDRGATLAGEDRSLINVTASYVLGSVKLFGNIARSRNEAATTPAGQRIRAYNAGLTVAAGGGLVKLAIGRLAPQGGASDSTKLGLGYEYPLSKRTAIRAALATGKTEGQSRTNGCEAGLRVTF